MSVQYISRDSHLDAAWAIPGFHPQVNHQWNDDFPWETEQTLRLYDRWYWLAVVNQGPFLYKSEIGAADFHEWKPARQPPSAAPATAKGRTALDQDRGLRPHLLSAVGGATATSALGSPAKCHYCWIIIVFFVCAFFFWIVDFFSPKAECLLCCGNFSEKLLWSFQFTTHCISKGAEVGAFLPAGALSAGGDGDSASKEYGSQFIPRLSSAQVIFWMFSCWGLNHSLRFFCSFVFRMIVAYRCLLSSV